MTLGAGTKDESGFGVDAGDASSTGADAGLALCIATACPAPWATCPAIDGTLPAYACGTNLDSDVGHCGSCDVACRQPSSSYNVQMGCSAGQCQAFCIEHFADCNDTPDDGCEASLLDDAENCGSCGAKCPSGVACLRGKCGCPPGKTQCGDACVDLAADSANCGSCGFSCAEHQPADAGLPSHMFYGCSQGACTEPSCLRDGVEYWSDCNKDESDGCEVDLRRDAKHCGKCDNQCDPGQQCFLSPMGNTECQCTQGQTLCPGAPPPFGNPYCADTENDPKNCGACGYVCPFVPNAKPVCSRGRCGSECLPGTADCNGRADDGCEADLNKDPRNCGSCGAACDLGSGQPCAGGRCAMLPCDGPVAK
ncbi:MAG: Tryptophan synthase alpha chain [Labilithrix sp.]|nr:Tryptophan synthase alpha chain [Labilithrix sp.]